MQKPIVILDEATAYADPENEDKMQESINQLTKSKAIIVIAHRLATIVDADQIVVWEDGVIESTGTHKELLKSSSVYQRLWKNHLGVVTIK
ncbi:hypothetical protein [Clostridium estertheticum]|uniref:hypothetical protein n=1 Tax=Clostridium estertheticum TaxID=238834 RepID=UPI001C6EAB4C|nr:hypothetical protein [Clostridium estertheticum]WLC83764.1 hypothetical protein KTC97_17155 [Clostridium estertheticum]